MLQWNASVLGLLANLARNPGFSAQPDYRIDGFPEYATSPDSLAGDQRQVLRAATQAIASSRATSNPVVAALVIGHSDKAMRKPENEQAAFELEVSQRRATSAVDSLV